MKNSLISVIFAIICLGYYGCSIDEPTYGKTTTENFYKKESDINAALAGAFLQLRETWNEYALNFYLINDCTTDDALKGGGNDGDRREVLELSNFTAYSTNGEVGRRWEILYRLVNRCNDVIYYAPNAGGKKELLERYAAEAKALRAFGYYSLVTSFGGVPLLLEPLPPGQIMEMTRASTETVWQAIEADLKDAASKLPAKGEYSEADAYRLTRGFAKTMLAKSYMFQGKFTEAENVLKEMVETDRDYTLLDDYGKNWRKEYENSSESVFEIANKMADNSKATGSNVPHFFNTRRGDKSGYGFHVPTEDLYNIYDPDDPRITYVFVQTGDRYVGDNFDQDNGDSPSLFYDYKIKVPNVEKEGFDFWMHPYNIRIIRYADVLLLYAEALNENGKASQALLYLNQIRQRARQTSPVDPRRSAQAYTPPTTDNTLPDITDTEKNALRELIRKERRCELAMEGWRRDDLLRWKDFGQVIRSYASKYNTAKGANFKDQRDYLLPIPQGEIDKTHELLTQNTGY
jgi:tetratricopeptide (TPR) repeat protein